MLSSAAAFGMCLKGWMLSSARLGAPFCVTLADFMVGAAVAASRCVQHLAWDWMLSSAAMFCVTGVALWRSLADFVAGAASSAFGCVCVSLGGRGSIWHVSKGARGWGPRFALTRLLALPHSLAHSHTLAHLLAHARTHSLTLTLVLSCAAFRRLRVLFAAAV